MNKLIIFIMFIILASSVYSVSDSNLYVHWNYTTGSGTTLIDSQGVQDGTHSADTVWSTNYAIYNDTGDSSPYAAYYNTITYTTVTHTSIVPKAQISLSIWINCTANQGDNSYPIAMASGFEGYTIFHDDGNACDGATSDAFCGFVYDGSGNRFFGTVTEAAMCNGDWHNYILVIDCTNSNAYAYFDGVSYGNNVSLTCSDGDIPILSSNPSYIGSLAGANSYDGKVDDIKIYEQVTSAAEAANIYNCGFSECVAPPAPINVTFIPPTPANGSTNNTQEFINVSCTDGNVTLWFDSNPNPITTVLYNATSAQNQSWLTNVTSDGVYYYKASCDIGGTNTSIRQWTYDGTQPEITIGGNSSYSSLNVTKNNYSSVLQFDINISDNIDLFGFIVNVTYSNGTVYYNDSNFSLSGNTLFIYSNSTTINTWPNGNYTVQTLAVDSHTRNWIPDYEAEVTGNKLIFDTAEGNEITVTGPGNSYPEFYKDFDRYIFGFDVEEVTTPNKIFFVSCDHDLYYLPDSDYPGHFVCWNSKTMNGNWIDFLIDAGEGYIPEIELVEPEIGEPAKYKITYDINFDYIKFKSIGGLNINRLDNWFFKSNISISDVSVSPIYGSDISNLVGSCTAEEGVGRNVSYEWIWYKNLATYYNGSSGTYVSGDSTELDTLPAANTTIGDNLTFSCRSYVGDNYTIWVNSTLVEILDIDIDNCSVYNNTIFSFYYRDEVSNELITTTTQYDLTFSADEGTKSLNGTFYGFNNNSFCTNIAPSNISINWSIEGQVTLNKSDYGTRLYDIGDISEGWLASNENPGNHTFYLIQLNQSSTVVFSWLTTSFLPISGTMEIYRCGGDGNRVLVGSEPIIDGQAEVNIELLNVAYSYEVIVGGVRYTDTTSYSKCHIETQTTRRFFVEIGSEDTAGVVGLYSIPCNITKTGNYSFNMAWGTNPESTAPITGCIKAYRMTVRGTSLIWQNCSTTSGIEATLADSGFTYFIKGKLYQDGYNIECQGQITFETATEANDTFGLTGILAVFFLIAGMILLFSHEQPKWYPIMGVLGIVFSWILGILAFGWLGISSLVFFVIVIIMVGRHGRKQ